MTEREQLERAIATLETQRAVLGDAVVDAALGPMREKLATLETQSITKQRKQVTVLFADVSGFTAISETLDAEEVGDIIKALWERVDAAIVAHGGTIDKHIGDAVMALWGVDRTRENDPERAIRAALDMQAELAAFRQERDVQLAMRVGLCTGSVLLGEVNTGEFTAIGDTVNLASCMEQAAPVGGILIAHDTYRHVRGIFDVQPQQALQIKGKTDTVQTYVVQRIRPHTFRVTTRGIEGIETRMVGRSAELIALQEAFYDTIIPTTGDTQTCVVTIVGEAGVGKSRLLYEFENWIKSSPNQVTRLKGRATAEMQNIPYSIIRDMFAFRFDIRESDSASVALAKFRAGTSAKLDADKAALVGHLVGFDFSASRAVSNLLGSESFAQQAIADLTNYLRAIATAPTIIFLEDTHWADDSSLDLIDHIVTAIPNAPLLIVCLARLRFLERRPRWGEDHEAYTRLYLKPLSKQSSRALVNEILQKVEHIPPTLHDLIVEGAEGNPFYVEELIKMLIDDGVIVHGEQQWRVELERLDDVRVPSTLTGVLQARLDSLPREEKTVLQRASVVGRLFWDAALAELTADKVEAARIDGLLAAVKRRELVFQQERSSFAETDEYVFRHAILRDVTYETVLLKLRRIYHRRVAQWLEHRGERVDEYAGLIAGHYERAGALEKAAQWYGRAGQQAADAYAPEIAISHYRQAIDLAQPHQVVEWHEGLGHALRARARYAEAVQAYTAMRATAEAAGDTLAQARAWNGLALVQEKQADYHAAQESAGQMEQLGARAGEAGREVYATALVRKGFTLCRLGDAAGALTLGERALALSMELGDTPAARRAQAGSLNLLGPAHSILGNFEQANYHFERALAVYRALGDRRYTGKMLNNLGVNASAHGDHATAVARYQESLEIAREIDDRGEEMLSLSNLGSARLGQGNYNAAEADLRQAIDMVGAANWFALSGTYSYLAEACLGQGKTAEALKAAQRALALGQETDYREDVGQAWRALGNCGFQIAAFGSQDSHVPQSAIPDPRSCYAKGLQIFTEIGAKAKQANTLRDWARYELTQGDEDEGAAMWHKARVIFETLNMPLEIARMDAERKP